MQSPTAGSSANAHAFPPLHFTATNKTKLTEVIEISIRKLVTNASYSNRASKQCTLLFEIKFMIKQNQRYLFECVNENTNKPPVWYSSTLLWLKQALIHSFIKTAFIPKSGTDYSQGCQSMCSTQLHTPSVIYLVIILLSIAIINKGCAWFSMGSIFTLLLFRNL